MQAWRLQDNPTSLCARVLKAKYFPNCEMINADWKKGASYTLQSIMEGLQRFARGIFGVSATAAKSELGKIIGFLIPSSVM